MLRRLGLRGQAELALLAKMEEEKRAKEVNLKSGWRKKLIGQEAMADQVAEEKQVFYQLIGSLRNWRPL